MLSPRAEQYLATFEQLPSVPIDHIKRWFAETGEPCFDVWLEFHERYAGLKDRTTGYVLGLAQPGQVTPPGRGPRIRCDEWGQESHVMIATVEGDEKYELDWRGHVRFDSERADCFERRLERAALLWEFEQRAHRYVGDDSLCQSLLPQLEDHWVREASDEYVDCYRNSRYLLFVNARTRYVDDVYECVEPVLVSYPGTARKPAPTPARSSGALLPLSIFREFKPSADPYRHMVERLSLLGNLETWDPHGVAIALGVDLMPVADDPSSPELRYAARSTHLFEAFTFLSPTFRSPFDFGIHLTPHLFPAAEPTTALAPLLPPDSRAVLAWPQKQDGVTPKRHSRDVQIGDNEITFVFSGDDFTGPQHLTSIYLERPRREVDSKKFDPINYRVVGLGDTAYSIRRTDDDRETVRVVDIVEDPRTPDRIAISFRCLDSRITIQDGSRLITTLIVQGVRRDSYLGRVEYLDYKELDWGLEYTRLWNQRRGGA